MEFSGRGPSSPFSTGFTIAGNMAICAANEARRASGRASLWTASAAIVSPARGSKSESSLGGEDAQGTGAKPA